MKLSDVQIGALYAMREFGSMNEAQAVIFIGKSRKQTMRSLERIGLIRWFPTPEHWKLTREGKEWLNDEDARRMVAEHQAATNAVVERYRKTEP